MSWGGDREMKRVLVYVEGQTEETFVRDILNPYLNERGIYLIPTLAVTKRIVGKPSHKGGIVTFEKVKGDIHRLLGDNGSIAVTTMIDFYALPSNFPGKQDKILGNVYDRVQYLEQKFTKDINNPKFRPYLSLHEFEALLFSRPQLIAETLGQPNKIPELNKIRTSFATPEEINDSPVTAPSKRLERLFPDYQKPLYGALIALNIGLTTLCQECPHFAEWVQWLEQL
jgi:hypothetical protein